MNLRRGVIVLLDDDNRQPALERAMGGVVERLHNDVESHATRDPLTGFLLRKLFADEIDRALLDAESTIATSAVLCHVGVTNLRQINDEGGGGAGDTTLKAVALELRKQIRNKSVIFGRLDGAAFGIYFPSGGMEAAYKKLQALIEPLHALSVASDGGVADAIEPDEAETVELAVRESESEAATIRRSLSPEIVIGICASGDNLVQADGLLEAAREACDSARDMGPGSIFVSGSETEQRRKMEQLVAYAEQALELGRLILIGQHVSSLGDDSLPPALYLAVSAYDRNGKAMPSSMFGPALLRCPQAAKIDMWAFKQTLAWILEHEEQSDVYPLFVVPLSSASLKDENLANLIMSEFMETPVPPGRICFSLPDHDVVENVIEVGELIAILKDFGCRFVLDEFGSGHQNYDYIKSIDIDFVTVRTGFISDARKSPQDFAMAKSINELVHFVGKKTIAKQARGLDLADMMREIGIDFLHDQTEQAQLVPEAPAT